MSQILDAINKAEQQRQQQVQPTSREDLYQALQLKRTEKKHNLLLPLGLVSLLGVSFSGFYIYKHLNLSVPSSSVANTTAETDIAPTLINEETTVNAIKPKVTEQQPLQQSAVTKEIKDVKSESQKPLIKQISPNPSSDKLSTKSHNAKLVDLTPVNKSETVNAKLEELRPIRINAPVVKKKPIVNKSSATKEKKNKIVSRETTVRPKSQKTTGAMSKHNVQKDSAPTASWKKNIHITAIVYNKNSNERFVLIRGVKIYEGGLIPNSNTAVVRILPQSIIINDGNGDTLIR